MGGYMVREEDLEAAKSIALKAAVKYPEDRSVAEHALVTLQTAYVDQKEAIHELRKVLEAAKYRLVVRKDGTAVECASVLDKTGMYDFE
jgi:hypothetical protein